MSSDNDALIEDLHLAGWPYGKPITVGSHIRTRTSKVREEKARGQATSPPVLGQESGDSTGNGWAEPDRYLTLCSSNQPPWYTAVGIRFRIELVGIDWSQSRVVKGVDGLVCSRIGYFSVVLFPPQHGHTRIQQSDADDLPTHAT